MDSNDKFFNIEQLLRDGNTIKIKPQGYSMYPLFFPGRDEAVIEPVDPAALRRGDVALYRRRESILVLHRIWKIRGQSFYMVGDNQTEIEGPLEADQFLGKLCALSVLFFPESPAASSIWADHQRIRKNKSLNFLSR